MEEVQMGPIYTHTTCNGKTAVRPNDTHEELSELAMLRCAHCKGYFPRNQFIIGIGDDVQFKIEESGEVSREG